MKIIKKGKFIYFKDYTKNELLFLKSLLAFKERIYSKYKKQLYKEHLFLFSKKGELYTWFGYIDYIKDAFNKIGENVLIEYNDVDDDLKIDLNKIKKLNNYELRDYQVMAVIRCLKEKFGNVVSATSSGKTLMIASLVNYISEPTLFIVPTKQLAEQLYHKLIEYGFSKYDTTIVNSKAKFKKYNVAVVNTIYNFVKSEVDMSFIKVIIYDEGHHRQAETYRIIDDYFNKCVDYNIGFTGSVYRYSKTVEKKKSLEDFIMLGLTGRKPIIKIDYKHLINGNYISVPYFYIETINYPQVFYKDWHKVYKELIINNSKRNEKIARWISYFYEKDFTILTLADRIDHIENIFKYIHNEQIKKDTIIVLGNNNFMIYEYGDLRKFKADYEDVMNKIREGYYKNVIASPVLKEGADIPIVNAVILAYAGKSEVSVVQKIGRGLRKTEDKDKVFIIDFYDNTHPYLSNHSKARLKIYKEQEFPLFFSKNKQENIYKKIVEKDLTNVF